MIIVLVWAVVAVPCGVALWCAPRMAGRVN